MYCNSIFQAIDSFATHQFVDDKIALQLNFYANFFLMEIHNINDSLVSSGNFERIFGGEKIIGLYSTGVVGLNLIKNNSNSIEDRVNPKFLQALKKTIQSYLSSLSSSWTEFVNAEGHNHFGEHCNGTQIVRKKYNKGPTHCILSHIACRWGFREKIHIEGWNSGTGLCCDTREDLKQFMEILRTEAKAAEREPRSLDQIASGYICSNPEAYPLQAVPKELIEKINNQRQLWLIDSGN